MLSLRNKIEEIEKEEIVKALQECNWVQAKAARKLGITERMIGYKIKKYKIKMSDSTVKMRGVKPCDDHAALRGTHDALRTDYKL